MLSLPTGVSVVGECHQDLTRVHPSGGADGGGETGAVVLARDPLAVGQERDDRGNEVHLAQLIDELFVGGDLYVGANASNWRTGGIFMSSMS